MKMSKWQTHNRAIDHALEAATAIETCELMGTQLVCYLVAFLYDCARDGDLSELARDDFGAKLAAARLEIVLKKPPTRRLPRPPSAPRRRPKQRAKT